jgi:hypothetical protein
MSTNKTIFKLFCALTLASATNLSAQVQLNIGYAVMKTQPNSLNQLITTFNESYGNQLVAPMPALKSLDGIHAEMAVFIDPVFIGVEWQNLTRDLTNRFNPTSEVTNTIHYANDMLSLHGSLMLHPNIGIGITGDYNIVQAKRKISTNSSASTLLMYDTQWSSRLYLHFVLPIDEMMSIGIRPYIRIPWNSISYAPIGSRLSLYEPRGVLPQDKQMDFGIQMVWQNFLSPKEEESY